MHKGAIDGMMLLIISRRITIDNLKGKGEGGGKEGSGNVQRMAMQKERGHCLCLSCVSLSSFFISTPALSLSPSSRFRSLLFY